MKLLWSSSWSSAVTAASALFCILSFFPAVIICGHHEHEMFDEAPYSSSSTKEDRMMADETKSRYMVAIPYSAATNALNKYLPEKDWMKKSASDMSYSKWIQNEIATAAGGDHYGMRRAPSNSYGYHHQETEEYSPGPGYTKGKEIAIIPSHKPITLHYRTHAQPLVIHQTRIPGPKPEVKHTTSHEEPHRVVHEVIRPIIQEVHEIIQPYRRVVQQVQPVIEEVRTIIAKDAGTGGVGPTPAVGSVPYKSSNNHYASSANELRSVTAPVKGGNPHQQLMYRKAALYDQEEDHFMDADFQGHGSIPISNRGQFIRSKVYITPKGVPVYQSNYGGPAY